VFLLQSEKPSYLNKIHTVFEAISLPSLQFAWPPLWHYWCWEIKDFKVALDSRDMTFIQSGVIQIIWPFENRETVSGDRMVLVCSLCSDVKVKVKVKFLCF
jgi:hypothetical protein